MLGAFAVLWCPPPHQAPGPSQLSSVLYVPQRKVSAVRPRRHLEDPLPRNLASQVSSRPGGFSALLRPQAEQTDSFTPATQFSLKLLIPPSHPAHAELYLTTQKHLSLGKYICHMAPGSLTSSKGSQKENETRSTMHYSRDGPSRRLNETS